MQNPVGADFNSDTMRMELTSFFDLVFNPTAQSKFVHTVSAGYVVGSVFVLSISAYYLLRGRHIAFAKRSIIVAGFGLASALSVVVLGDESGYTTTQNQKMKFAAIEANGTPRRRRRRSRCSAYRIRRRTRIAIINIPWALGLIATRSFDKRCRASMNW